MWVSTGDEVPSSFLVLRLKCRATWASAQAPEIAPLDQVLFAFAAYNAGLRNVARARKRAARMGLDPNRWFGHVEVAAAKIISREPEIYVRNIYKYYVAYKQLAALREARNSGTGLRD